MSPPGALPRPVRGGARLRPFNAEALPGLNPPKGDACARRNGQPRRKRGSGQGWRRSLPGRGRIHHGQFVRPHTNLQAAVEAAVDCCPPCACESRKASPAARPSPVRARPYPPGRRALHDQAVRRLDACVDGVCRQDRRRNGHGEGPAASRPASRDRSGSPRPGASAGASRRGRPKRRNRSAPATWAAGRMRGAGARFAFLQPFLREIRRSGGAQARKARSTVPPPRQTSP